jgi:hypothetical protein
MVFDRGGCIRILRTRHVLLTASLRGFLRPGIGVAVVATQDPRPWIPEITQ